MKRIFSRGMSQIIEQEWFNNPGMNGAAEWFADLLVTKIGVQAFN
ncbi:MAG: hypothetical protein ONB31_11540 [candidate division KSB1 bacterium]|nr:hypothetical protein [candidate division KSB1 bacterium]MDZ7335428.1 hypothetical protein [candidate division KSB1 bacterium]MDZ7358585.1 hypothetical protein [candidate division KSB1 bacterium]MDZ7401163.1 hypothetical protein [candidate division KSB1 bacterium]